MIRSLRSQYLLVSVVMFVAMLALLLWNSQRLIVQALEQRFEAELRAYEPLLSAALGPLLVARDYATLSELVEQNVNSRQLPYLEVLDASGNRVARAGDEGLPGLRRADAAIVMAGQRLGEVRWAIRGDLLASVRDRLWRDGLVIGAVVLAAGGLLLAAVLTWISRGLGQLTQASRRVAEGDYATQLPASRVRELDEVAAAFNRMSQAIEAQLTELRDSQQFLRGVLDTLSEGFVIVDRDNRVLDCNETFLRLHAVPRPGHEPLDIARHGTVILRADGSELPAEERMTRAVLATGRPQRDQVVRIRRADGSESWVSINASPLVTNDGQAPLAAMATMTDITRHVEAERALRSINEDLEQRVRERTAELEQAKQDAERASHAKSDFLSRMSHELRTPLNAILGFAQLLALETGRLNDADRARLRHIEDAGWHLLALINDVLDLSRIEAGAMRTSSEPVELGALVAEALSMVQAQAAGRRLVLQAPSTPSGGMWVLADRVRLKQVLANLLSNAVKYNRDGGEVAVTIDGSADGRCTLSVRDSGRGMTPEQLAQLFQPFTRFVSADEVVEGTGIGLVITRRLVELMGGGIAVESTPGVGSVFRVDLPSAAAPGSAPAARLDAAPAPALDARPRRLLLVEDNPSNVELLRQVVALRPAWTLAVSTDGLAGLQRLLQERFDLALVDIDLPGLDGLALCRRARAEAAGASLPMLAISAAAMPSDVRRALAAGFDDHIAKPLDVVALLKRLDRLLADAADRRPDDAT
jgi:PAS domain S-box-containing protein